MKWHTQNKMTKAMQRTLTLLLAALMLSSSVLAAGVSIVQGNSGNRILWDSENQEYKDYLKANYGKDWQKIAALQPGDSYISGETMYLCSEETYVDWKRVYNKDDLDTSDWDGEDRLLLMTDTSGKYLFLGNDYAKIFEGMGGARDQFILKAVSPTDTRQVIDGITEDTSAAEYVEEPVYPELNAFYQESTGGYPYPDTFRTLGTMNAPYIRAGGLDSDNGNNKKFRIILSKDDGSISLTALTYTVQVNFESVTDWASKRLTLRSVSQGSNFTFYPNNGKVKIFRNVEDNEDLVLCNEGGNLYGKDFDNPLEAPNSDMVIYVGEKAVGKHIEVVSLALEDAEQNPEALENVYGGAIEFYHWEKITSSSQLPTGNDTYRALLVWEDLYFLQGDDFRESDAASGMTLYVNEEKAVNDIVPSNVEATPEIDLAKDEFYTMGGLGTPYIRFTHKSTDSDNDYCPYYTFQLAGMDDQPSRKWLCDGDNVLEVCLDKAGEGNYGGIDIGIIVGKEGDDDNDADLEKVKLFLNESGGFDTQFMYSGNGLYGDDEGWDCSQFTLYIGKPVIYPAVRQNYVVAEDQFMHISQNGAMLNNVTIMVEKGGVLSIESWFINNGRIIVNGGTLIVQEAYNPLGDEMADDTEDSVMMPFGNIHPLVSGSLELRNGGELIIMDNARAAFSNIKATTGSSILNCGILLAETMDLHSTTLVNRENAAILAGYYFQEMYSFRTDDLIVDKNGARMPKMVTRLEDSVYCITRRMYSSVHNDGWITYGARRSSVQHDSVKATGSGTYTKIEGEKPKYMPLS